MKTLVDPPVLRTNNRDPNVPRTLAAALEKCDVLESRLKELERPGATKRFDASASPTYPPAPLKTLGADEPSKSKMPVNLPKEPAKPLSASIIDAPVPLQAVLDQMTISELRLALNGEKTKLMKIMLYKEIKSREALMR